MLFAAHAITAGVVGEAIGNPFLAFLAGIIIHFILDAIPHYDSTDGSVWTKRQWLLALCDLLLGLYVIFYVLNVDIRSDYSFVAGAFGGIFPDLFDVLPFWREGFRKTRIGKIVHRFHERVQSRQISFIPGILVQVIVVLVFSCLYLK